MLHYLHNGGRAAAIIVVAGSILFVAALIYSRHNTRTEKDRTNTLVCQTNRSQDKILDELLTASLPSTQPARGLSDRERQLLATFLRNQKIVHVRAKVEC